VPRSLRGDSCQRYTADRRVRDYRAPFCAAAFSSMSADCVAQRCSCRRAVACFDFCRAVAVSQILLLAHTPTPPRALPCTICGMVGHNWRNSRRLRVVCWWDRVRVAVVHGRSQVCWGIVEVLLSILHILRPLTDTVCVHSVDLATLRSCCAILVLNFAFAACFRLSKTSSNTVQTILVIVLVVASKCSVALIGRCCCDRIVTTQ